MERYLQFLRFMVYFHVVLPFVMLFCWAPNRGEFTGLETSLLLSPAAASFELALAFTFIAELYRDVMDYDVEEYNESDDSIDSSPGEWA